MKKIKCNKSLKTMYIFSNFFNSKDKNVEIISQYSIEIPKCVGNRFVISDIHGCLQTLEELIEKMQLTKDDQVFFLGDYIDRGRESAGVLDYIIDLKNRYQVFPLKGNHEDDLLLLLKIKNQNLIERYLKNENKRALFNSDYQLHEKYFNFITQLPYFIVLEEYILVHAGFDFKKPKPFENTEQMLWIRNMEYDGSQANNKIIIHGHTPYPLDEIQTKLKNHNKIIPLDNGCFFNKDEDFGNLLCLNLTTRELIVQKNID